MISRVDYQFEKRFCPISDYHPSISSGDLQEQRQPWETFSDLRETLVKINFSWSETKLICRLEAEGIGYLF